MIPEEEILAEVMYEAYCKSVGGKAFNDDPLPGWDEFRADESKRKQSGAWVDAAIAALRRLSGE